MDDGVARRVWRVLEPVHAVTYFAPESIAAHKAVGLRGFWMGYFGGRAAPLGAVSAGVVAAAFYNFHPAMVRRAVPDAWGFAAPEAVVTARQEAAAAALRRVDPGIEGVARELDGLLRPVVETADGAGRVLFAANRELEDADDPVARVWQLATCLREQRGDGHVAVLAAEGLDGCEAHVLFAAAEGTPAEVLRANRGWSPQEWAATEERLLARGLLVADGGASVAGRALRSRVEARTDALAGRPYRVWSSARTDRAVHLLGAIARRVVDAGDVPFPNPMGLPAL
ncbi:hypothetical protein [Streptomyces sp. SID3343]|uniref:SCO6745 family protein n=1 Tax=Streptomyces sp. SID3343 TaxID=2690260 RepID=UPI00136BC853|nr:hypothetical protein [Streptomyces sp. SID3343]MYW03787.1 hypothetical protein [Streptomyces sp. SID3343]